MGVQMSRGSLSIPRQRDVIALILGCLKLSDGFCTGSHYISIARPWIYMKDETLLASTMIMSSEESGTSPSSSSLDVPMTVIDEKGRSQNNRVRRKYESFSWKNGYNINYRVEGPGDGKPILLVHGFGANVVSSIGAGK